MNPDSVRKFIKDINQELKKDPHTVAWVPIDPDSGENGIEVARLSDKTKEMDYANIRQQIANEIGGFFAVEPIFRGDVSGAGGLNNEGTTYLDYK